MGATGSAGGQTRMEECQLSSKYTNCELLFGEVFDNENRPAARVSNGG